MRSFVFVVFVVVFLKIVLFSQSVSSSPALDELEKGREETTRLLQDYALGRSDERAMAARIGPLDEAALPPVRPEPETGLSLDVRGGVLAATQAKLMHVVFDTKASNKKKRGVVVSLV